VLGVSDVLRDLDLKEIERRQKAFGFGVFMRSEGWSSLMRGGTGVEERILDDGVGAEGSLRRRRIVLGETRGEGAAAGICTLGHDVLAMMQFSMLIRHSYCDLWAKGYGWSLAKLKGGIGNRFRT